MSDDKQLVEQPDFSSLGLPKDILQAITNLGFVHPTPIQARAIPVLLEGSDVIGRARTGSGKTAAFGLPLLQSLERQKRKPQALVLAPTRELAIQVSDALQEFSKGTGIKITCIYGGAPYPPQLRALKAGASVIVGTPGRTIDHIQRGSLDLSAVQFVVLDEADEMLRMGFIEDVETILSATPDSKQVALFSATMPPRIRRIGEAFMQSPKEIKVESKTMSTEHIEQKWLASRESKKTAALQRIIEGWVDGSALVFTRTRKGCAQVADSLNKAGIFADALHGDMNQNARERVLSRLRSKQLQILVATDVAARGIDVDHLTHVINYDLTSDTESYVHRIGRTGRAGRKGVAISLVTPAERRRIRRFEKELKVVIEQVQLPSLKKINNLRFDRLQEDLVKATIEPIHEDVKERLTSLQGLLDQNVEDIALVLLQQLAYSRRISFHVEEVSHDSHKSDEHEWNDDLQGEQLYAHLNEVEVVLNIGKREGIGPGDLVFALANYGDVTGKQIGRLTILGRKTFVGLPHRLADRMLSMKEPMTIRGKEVRVYPNLGEAPKGKDKSTSRRRKRSNSNGRNFSRGQKKRPFSKPAKRRRR